MTDPTSDDVRDDFILQERLSGKSARAISKQLRCTVGEVDAALDRVLPKLDNAARLRHISLDLNRLDRLLEVFYKRAIEDVDTQAGLLCVKILERKSAMLGLDSPQKLDVVQLQAAKEPTQHEKITAAIMRLTNDQPPARREAVNLIDKLGHERALELLKAGSGNGHDNGHDNGSGGDASSDPDPDPAAS
jgi:hypothetical protein